MPKNPRTLLLSLCVMSTPLMCTPLAPGPSPQPAHSMPGEPTPAVGDEIKPKKIILSPIRPKSTHFNPNYTVPQ